MLVVVSPAKKLNMHPINKVADTKPLFAENVNELITEVRKLSSDNLKDLMGISTQLAELNKKRFTDFGKQDKKAAAFAFAGDTYKGLDAETLSSEDLNWAQNHLRIISGLYGVLRPLDDIEPYRLEMGSKLEGKHGKSLYDYWGKKISEKLNDDAKNNGSNILINCASNEYFNAIHSSSLSLNVITPIFIDRKNGKEKVISFYAKKARGTMARFIIQNRLTKVDELKSFDIDGYKYQSDQSTDKNLSFVRDHPLN